MPVRALLALVIAIVAMVAGAWLMQGAPDWTKVVVTQLAVAVAVVVAAGTWRPGRPPLRHLGIGLALAVPAFLASLAIGAFSVVIAGPPSDEPVTRAILSIRDLGGWPLLLAVACVLPGLVEEALFRGVMLHHLRTRWPRWPVIALVAIAFAAMHWSPWRFAPQLCLGLILGWATYRWSWWTAAVAHAGHNACVLTVVVLVPKPGA